MSRCFICREKATSAGLRMCARCAKAYAASSETNSAEESMRWAVRRARRLQRADEERWAVRPNGKA